MMFVLFVKIKGHFVNMFEVFDTTTSKSDEKIKKYDWNPECIGVPLTQGNIKS